MELNKLVTIFIVTYNRANFLEECIKSVLNSTYKNFDLYILDNASVDNTEDIVNSFSDKRIKYIKHPINIGGISNINYAIQMCKTKYFIVFHDDDIMGSNLIEIELSEMEKNEEYSIISSKSSVINADNEVLFLHDELVNEENYKKCYSGNEYIKLFWRGKVDGVNCPSVMFRNDFFKKHNLKFKENVGPAADQYLWFEVERNGGKICCLNYKLMNYRLHEGQDSRVNALTMDVKLYISLYNSVEYKNIILEYSNIIEKRFLRSAVVMGNKYLCCEIEKEIYLEYIDKIMYVICRSKLSIILLKCLKIMILKFPKVYKILYTLLKKTIRFGRNMKAKWVTIKK